MAGLLERFRLGLKIHWLAIITRHGVAHIPIYEEDTGDGVKRKNLIKVSFLSLAEHFTNVNQKNIYRRDVGIK